MRVKIVLAVAALLLACGAVYLWNPGGWTLAGWNPGDWIERGQAATTPTQVAPTPVERPARPGLNARLPSVEDRPVTNNVVPVVVASVRKGEVPVYLSGIGTVQAYNSIAIKSQVDGVILRLNFEEGQDVKVGDPLVIIDPQTYQARLEQAQALKARAVTALENAKTNLWREEELLKKDFATQRKTDETRMHVGQYTAEIAQYDAEIKYAQAQLDYATIRSPVNGRIGIRKVDPGNLIRAADNTTIVTINQLQPISVIITLPAKELARHDVSLGQTDLPVIAYAENGVTPLGRGKIQLVDNTVDPTTGTVKLKAVFPNERYKLWPGDFVDCKVTVEKRPDGLTVPTAAIRHGPKGDFTWVVKSDSTVELRPVRIKQTLGGTALIDLGLQANEKVVLDGHRRLQPGTRVEIVPAAADSGSKVSSAE